MRALRSTALAAAGGALVALTGCGGGAGALSRGPACDPGDRVYEAIAADPVVRSAAFRPEVGTREGVRSEYSDKTRACGPIVFTRQWDLARLTAQERMTRLDGEIRSAGWQALPPVALTRGRYTLVRGYERDYGGTRVTLAVSHERGAPVLTGLIEARVQPGR